MSRTAILRRQHDVALELVEDLNRELAKPAPDPFRLGMTLAKLTGLLRIHLAQEDQILYPHLLGSADPSAAALAAAFQSEMGDLGARFAAFTERWASSVAIGSDLEGFRAECRQMFAALAVRIRRENEVLYPIADSTEPASRSAA